MNYTLVTGATSDIGVQICKTLEDSGHCLLMTDLKEESLNDLRKTLNNPQRHLILPMDLSDVEKSKNDLTAFISEKGVQVSKSVFAAGIFALKPLRMIDYAFLKKSFDIALFSVFAITQVLASKKTNGDALKNIVIISSVNSKMGVKGYSVYASLKASMLGWMKSMAVELAPRVRVNAVLPGGIKTRTTQFLYDASGAETNPRYLLGEGKCDDIANMIDFLLSEKSRWITGQEFIVDGGLTCN